MKRMTLISVVIMLGLFLGPTAQAGPVVNPGAYCTDESLAPDWCNEDPCSCNEDLFFTKFWKEKFLVAVLVSLETSLWQLARVLFFRMQFLKRWLTLKYVRGVQI